MRYIENIVIGYPIYQLKELVSDCTDADYEQAYEKTYFTHKRNLAAILKDIGVVQSVNEVRRNKPEYCKELTDLDCFWIKWGKRRFYVVVGCLCSDCFKEETEHVDRNYKRRHRTDF